MSTWTENLRRGCAADVILAPALPWLIMPWLIGTVFQTTTVAPRPRTDSFLSFRYSAPDSHGRHLGRWGTAFFTAVDPECGVLVFVWGFSSGGVEGSARGGGPCSQLLWAMAIVRGAGRRLSWHRPCETTVLLERPYKFLTRLEHGPSSLARTVWSHAPVASEPYRALVGVDGRMTGRTVSDPGGMHLWLLSLTEP